MILKKRNQNSDCAIILTVHNHIEMFGFPCLQSLLKHSGGARVYVYDNESTDPKIENLRKLADSRSEVEFIRIDDQKTFGGLTGTWNDGIRRAREQGFSKVILLNHDVIVDNTWGNFIQAIESDFCIYGPLTNRPGGGPRDRELQMADRAEFQGLRNTRILMGFCMGFTLGRPELKLFDDWRFFNPERPFGGNEFDIQDRMKMRSTKAAFYIVTDSWVFHHLNMGWKDSPRYMDPHGPDNTAQRKTVTAKMEHLAGCVIPQAVPLKRERVHAVPDRTENYDELYDFKTLFYDAFYTASRGTVTLIAPKLLNLQKIISSGTFQFDDVTVSNKRLHKALGFDRLVLRTGFRPQVMRLNWQDLELSIPVRDDGAKEFAGLNCLVTVSKNNRLQWIEDWAAHHVHRQGVEAILFFDNGSDAYSPADIAGTLSGIDGLKTFKVVSAPFKYGPWARAKFLQTALFNLARLSYLRESAATLIVDIDELVQTTGGKTVFDYTMGRLLGYTRIKGRHRYAISAKQQDAIRHKDHLHIDADDRGKSSKFCIVPSGPLRFFDWAVHGLGMYPFNRFSSHRCVSFDHFYAISTNWKIDRRWPVYGKNYVEDKFFSGSDC